MVGKRILDRFTIAESLGSGGFGHVYRAWDERLDRPVAVKLVHVPATSAERASREAQAAARLSHRAIATMYELARAGEHTVLVCELVEGETLAERAANGELSDRALASIGAEAASALVHAHRHGVVHRDIKPQNLMIPDGTALVKVVDFGVARISDRETLTRTGAVVGTLAYMAPEQADGLRAGPAADVFSLALSLYECLTGVHPHLRHGPAATARAIGEPVESLGALRPDLPGSLVALIDSALDPDPEERPLASELERDLRTLIPTLRTDPLPPMNVADALPREPHRPRAPIEASAPVRVAAAAAIGVAAAAALVAAGAGGAMMALVPPGAALLCLRRPTAAVLLATGFLALALAGNHGAGAMAALILAAAPLAIATHRVGHLAIFALAAPPLAAAGLPLAFLVLAALGSDPARRATIALTGALLIAFADVALSSQLLIGSAGAGAAEWAGSPGSALVALAGILLDPTALGVLAGFAAGAVLLPVLIAGRAVPLDLMGALLWVAGAVSVTTFLVPPSEVHPALVPSTVAAVAAYALAVNPAIGASLPGGRLRPRPDGSPMGANA